MELWAASSRQRISEAPPYALLDPTDADILQSSANWGASLRKALQRYRRTGIDVVRHPPTTPSRIGVGRVGEASTAVVAGLDNNRTACGSGTRH